MISYFQRGKYCITCFNLPHKIPEEEKFTKRSVKWWKILQLAFWGSGSAQYPTITKHGLLGRRSSGQSEPPDWSKLITLTRSSDSSNTNSSLLRSFSKALETSRLDKFLLILNSQGRSQLVGDLNKFIHNFYINIMCGVHHNIILFLQIEPINSNI